MKSIICLFTSIDKARLATETLLLSGFELELMNLVVQETVAKNKLFISDYSLKVEENRSKYPLSGLERLFCGKQPFVTPDAGKVLYAGPEAATVLKTASDKPEKGLKYALMQYQLSESVAEFFKNGVKEGGLLLWVRTEDLKAMEVARIMEYRNGIKIVSF